MQRFHAIFHRFNDFMLTNDFDPRYAFHYTYYVSDHLVRWLVPDRPIGLNYIDK